MSNLPKTFMQRWYEKAKTVTFMGYILKELDQEELAAIAAFFSSCTDSSYVNFTLPEVRFCCDCKHVFESFGSESTIHPDSLCGLGGEVNFVTKKRYGIRCKFKNSNGQCEDYEEKEG